MRNFQSFISFLHINENRLMLELPLEKYIVLPLRLLYDGNWTDNITLYPQGVPLLAETEQ
ncbi:MAG: hypothetical protein IE909_18465 [Campylobacterales bacterium]|nr:hypothetical protein [Campylobacterales bacterium]